MSRTYTKRDGGQVWTEAKVNELSRLWEVGLTAARIGAELGFSKNAVCGKRNRIGLPKRGHHRLGADNPNWRGGKRIARLARARRSPIIGSKSKLRTRNKAPGSKPMKQFKKKLPGRICFLMGYE